MTTSTMISGTTGSDANAVNTRAEKQTTKEWVLVLGATSGIARAVAHRLGRDGHSLLLAGRNLEELQRLASDLQLRYHVRAEAILFSALDFSHHGTFFESVIGQTAGRLGGVMLCYGDMQPQAATETDFVAARQMIDVNFTSAVSILSLAANYLEERRSGFIGIIYTYGATKAALSAFAQGLRNRLSRAGVHVLTIKPGFVATRMTAGLLDPNSPMVASPERVANDIVRALAKRRPIVYTPWYWRYIMALICTIPERIFQRMKL
jgi:decaprenylphospho-beta-D-erythro-pentofuranosid-2-ulose 2-reductase